MLWFDLSRFWYNEHVLWVVKLAGLALATYVVPALLLWLYLLLGGPEVLRGGPFAPLGTLVAEHPFARFVSLYWCEEQRDDATLREECAIGARAGDRILFEQKIYP